MDRDYFYHCNRAVYGLLAHRDILPTDLKLRQVSYSYPLHMNKPDVVYKKPAGEAGGMGRGGYRLQTALGWPVEIYKKVQVCHSSLFLICSNLCL